MRDSGIDIVGLLDQRDILARECLVLEGALADLTHNFTPRPRPHRDACESCGGAEGDPQHRTPAVLGKRHGFTV